MALNVKAGAYGACQLIRVLTMCCFIHKIYKFSNCTDPRALNYLVFGDISDERVGLVTGVPVTKSKNP